MDLQGKVAVITGAASGIGLALTRRCVEAGMRVAMADIEEIRLGEEVARLKEVGAEVIGVPTDVSRSGSVGALAAETGQALGPTFLLVNNAGVGTVGPPVWTLTDSDWRWVLEVNLFGVINGLQAFLPGMVERGEGHVVNIASAAGLLSPRGMAPYAVSKHGIVALSEVLHHELRAEGLGVGVTLVCPGLVATRMADNERNRPTRFALSESVAAARQSTFADAVDDMRGAVASGQSPEAFAGMVMEAVMERRFYVVSGDWVLDAFRVRSADIYEGREPTDPS